MVCQMCVSTTRATCGLLINFSMKVSYNWLKEYVGEKLPSADEVAALLTKHAFEIDDVEEIDGDTVIDVDVLPNRASDCLCHRGVARELATIMNVALARDPLTEPVNLEAAADIVVNIADANACPRFTAALITGIEVKESPDWLKARLKALGQRPINNIVDATNYVMYAIGQPLHAYDADLFPKVDGTWKFDVRVAKPGERVSLIPEGGKEEDRIVECEGTELLIVDGSSDTPIGLAGVKGGRFAGVHAGTKNIIIEAAHFHPTRTRQTARRLGIVIDASKRFENEPSRELPPFAQRDIIALITDIAGGTFEGWVDEYLEEKKAQPVDVRVSKTNALLGLTLPRTEIADIIARTGAEVFDEADADTITCLSPFERTDLNIEEDYIEEVGRIHGLTDIASVVPEKGSPSEINARQFYSEKIRQILFSLGYSEVITSSFNKKDDIQLLNALASDKSYLRSSLTKNLSETLDKNAPFADLLGTPDTRIFEIGTVFYKKDDTVTEHVSLCFGVRLKVSGYTGKEDKVLQETIAAIETALGTKLAVTTQKGVAEVNLTELLTSLPAPAAYEPFVRATDVTFKPFSTFPYITRDIALWVTEGTTAAEVESVLNEQAGELRVRTTKFDEFTKDGRTSYAFRLVFQSQEKTLTDTAVNEVMDAVYAVVAKEGWEVR